MFLDSLPLVFILVGLVLYAVLGGADFGAGAGRLFAGGGPEGDRIRDHAHHAMGPVWEANHVWLIFVLVVAWTAYPVFLASFASTLVVPLLIAGIGIIFRGASYALRSVASDGPELRRADTLMGAVSLLTPFFLGTCVGSLAAGRVPTGNAAGGLWSSWTGPIAILAGALATAFSAYLAGVFLAADAARGEDQELVRAMRRRALAAGLLSGALALAGLVVMRLDARSLYDGMTHGVGLAMLVTAGIAGIATIGLVFRERFEPARYTAALAVAAVVAGWALARWPTLLPGLTIRQAAASHDTLVCVVVVVVGGAALLFPSLALLFSLAIRGRLDGGPGEQPQQPATILALPSLLKPGAGLRAEVALLIIGVGTLNATNAGWTHLIGVLSLGAFIVIGVVTIVTQILE